MKKTKLTAEEKLKIFHSSSEKSLRELGREYNVHHSSIAEILKEAEESLLQLWMGKEVGRPAIKTTAEQEESKSLKQEMKVVKEDLALKSMRVDWFALQLDWAKERCPKLKGKAQLKKKEKIAKIELVKTHDAVYSDVSNEKRLECLDTTPGSFRHLCQNVRDRLKRESAIPEDDIKATIETIIAIPEIGSRKGALTLLDKCQAFIGATNYNEIKTQLVELSEEEYAKRKEQSELEKNQYRRRAGDEKFEKISVERCHEVWAIDFTQLMLFGIKLFICLVYDLHSQGYLSLVPCETPTAEVAKQAVIEACRYSKAKPERCLLSDNGSQFLSLSYQELLSHLEINDLKIPPGMPWFNGALESGNRDLKRSILAIAFYESCVNMKITKRGVSRKAILEFLKLCCDKAQERINERISRVKFGTTPVAVLRGEEQQKELEREAFKRKKQEERVKRIKDIKEGKLKSGSDL